VSQPPVHRLQHVSSTLDLVHEYAGQGAPGGTVVIAAEQMEGRGTRGRGWHSPVGGLWFSILYRDAVETGLESLSLRIGLAVARAVESVVPAQRLGIKWPNDLMLGERKLGGVLCEARWQGPSLAWVGVGVGVNVTNPIPPELQVTAVSLASVAPVSVPALVGPVVEALRNLSLQAESLSAEELAELRGRDWLQGRRLVEPVPGIARGILADGSLLVEQAAGDSVSVRAGQIRLG
jgi:BirA family biotin operon repressor/biotin-[acetyl-CoA-carboxylase] ligase